MKSIVKVGRKLDEGLLWAFVVISSLLRPQRVFAQGGGGISSTTAQTVVQRGLGFALWAAIGVFGILGIIVFGSGIMRMWDTDDPRQKKSGMARMGWGVVLLIAVLMVVGLKVYLANGVGPSSSDLNPYGSGLSDPGTLVGGN